MRVPSLPLLPIAVTIALAATACVGGQDDVTDAGAGTGTSVTVPTNAGSDADTNADSNSDSDQAEETPSENADADGQDPATNEADDQDPDVDETTTRPEPTNGDWAGQSLQLTEVATLAFPTAMATRPGSDDLWVAERAGVIRRIERQPDPTGGRGEYQLTDGPVLDITSLVSEEGEGGLLGLTFSADGNRVFVSYTNDRGASTVAEYQMNDLTADPATERVVLQVEQPFSNHNGGQIELGPDGYLYIALGDGGSGGDPLGSGQDLSTLLGAMLRIDPDADGGETGYGVPTDNPFVNDSTARPEIWAYGLRNPWKFSFDSATGELWIGDVGQNNLEEIDVIPPGAGGANFGWAIREGNAAFADQVPDGFDPVEPLYVYGRDRGCSVTGGYVYRGSRIPDFNGVYLFSDFCETQLVGIERQSDSILVADLSSNITPGPVVSFGQDNDGELYVLTSEGQILLIEPA